MYVIQPFLDINLLLHASSEVDQGGLAGAVAGAVRDGYGAGPRGDVEDAAAALRLEVGEEEAHEVVRTVEVHSELVDEGFWGLSVELDGAEAQGRVS